jgi:FAD synthetase
MKKALNTVMVFGTFDHLHTGHKYFLRQAGKQGNYLIAVIARDNTVKSVKGKYPKYNENERLEAIKGLNLVDKVVLGNIGDKYLIIKQFQPDIICLGYDQTYFIDRLKNNLKKFKLKTKIIRLKALAPQKYKSSIINKIK